MTCSSERFCLTAVSSVLYMDMAPRVWQACLRPPLPQSPLRYTSRTLSASSRFFFVGSRRLTLRGMVVLCTCSDARRCNDWIEHIAA